MKLSNKEFKRINRKLLGFELEYDSDDDSYLINSVNFNGTYFEEPKTIAYLIHDYISPCTEDFKIYSDVVMQLKKILNKNLRYMDRQQFYDAFNVIIPFYDDFIIHNNNSMLSSILKEEPFIN